MGSMFTKNKTVTAISSVPEFHSKVRRECERADRYGMRLSMAVYEVPSRDENNLVVRRLIRTLHRRVRNIDDIGWFGKGKVGILLPHTPSDGAFKLAEDIYHLMSPIAATPPFTIYTYPSALWPVKPRKNLLPITDLLNSMRGFFGKSNINTSDELRTYLELELDRSTRHGHIFSLLVYNLDAMPQESTTAQNLARALNSRLRETDEFGWYGSNKMAAILPYASGEDTNRVGETICSMIGITSPFSCFTVYTYPTNWFTDTKKPDWQGKPRGDGSTANDSTVKESDGEQQEGETADHSGLERRGVNHNGEERAAEAWNSLGGLRRSEVDEFVVKPVPRWKRGMDVVGAVLGILLCSPLFFLAALGIKLTSPGPIFFQQQRIGYRQKPFQLLKFRTMHAHCSSDSHRKFMKQLLAEAEDRPDTKMNDDERIFSFGRFLRKTSMDELPQLINVLRGEMSLVGPRPCLDYEAEEFKRWHTKRFFIMPGMTGLWQVSGKNRLSFKQMVRLDISYERHLSFWLDLKILLKTLPAVISIFLEKQAS